MDIYDQLRRDEGWRKLPYRDSVRGDWTIGCGFNLTTVGLYDEEIEFILQNRVAKLTDTLKTKLPWFPNIDSVRQGVLANMSYNLGFNGLEEFQGMLHAFAQGDWQTAADEMKNSEWAKQVGDRAARLEKQVLTGEWQ
jgi:lysozyme